MTWSFTENFGDHWYALLQKNWNNWFICLCYTSKIFVFELRRWMWDESLMFNNKKCRTFYFRLGLLIALSDEVLWWGSVCLDHNEVPPNYIRITKSLFLIKRDLESSDLTLLDAVCVVFPVRRVRVKVPHDNNPAFILSASCSFWNASHRRLKMAMNRLLNSSFHFSAGNAADVSHRLIR